MFWIGLVVGMFVGAIGSIFLIGAIRVSRDDAENE